MRSSWVVEGSFATGRRGARIFQNVRGIKKVKVRNSPSKTLRRWLVGEKTQRQVQFLCPKMNHLSMDEKFSMRTPKVTKKFRFLYNKGVVHDDGTIASFYN